MRGESFGQGVSDKASWIEEVRESFSTNDPLLKFHDMIRSNFDDAIAQIRRSLLPKGPQVSGDDVLIEGDLAYRYLNQLREDVLRDGQSIINRYSPSTWLWYLRRADPHVYKGSLSTTPANVFRVAECLSSLSTRSMTQDRFVTESPLAFAIDHQAALRVAELIAMAVVVNLLENHVRRSSKGQKFRLQSYDLPAAVEDSALEAAIVRFDERNSAPWSNPWHASLDLKAGLDSGGPLLLSAVRTIEGWQSLPGWIGTPESFVPVSIWGQFPLMLFSLGETASGVEMSGSAVSMSDPEVSASIVALASALARYMLTMPNGGMSLQGAGYFVIHHDVLVPLLERVLESDPWPPFRDVWSGLSSTGIIKKLKKHPVPGQASTHGPLIRTCSVGHMVDAVSLTAEAFECVRIDPSSGGAWANAGSFDFELQVQGLINDSPFKPEADVLALRGRSLSDNRGVVTDVDALLEVQGDLVLVSCKKVEQGQDFDRGVYKRIANSQSTVVQGLESWARRIERIRLSPRGRNYDFTRFNRVVGVLLTPGVVFLHDTSPLDPTAELPEMLRPHMSFGEFQNAIVPG